MSEPAIDPTAQVSHEDSQGRVLSGVGVSAERLAETMERHEPEETTPPAPAGGTADAPSAGTAAPAAPEPPVSRGRQRFADLTREREEARKEAATAKAEREALARELETLRAKPAAAAVEPEKPAAPVTREPTRPMPTEEEVGAKYETYAAFARDLAKWEIEQDRASYDPAAQVREILAQERQRESFSTALQSAQDRARKAYPDFDTVLAQNGKTPLGRTQPEAIERAVFIVNHPQSEHIQYALLKDAALLQRVQQASALEFGSIVAGLVPSQTAAPRAAAAWTPPPAPHPTVGASSPTTAPSSSELASKGFDFDKSGYREKRAAESGRKSRY